MGPVGALGPVHTQQLGDRWVLALDERSGAEKVGVRGGRAEEFLHLVTQRAADETGDARMMLVLDASGSMRERAQGGMTKIAAAQKALTSVVADLPVDARVGLRVFGATVENAGDKGACTDSQLVVPVGTNNKAALQAAISTHKPYGETPIGYALEEAAKDLGKHGKRSIILVDDGEATCAPDPCETAKKIAASGVDVSINVVGLSVDAKTRKQLQCIASQGNGDYYDAKDADELSHAIEKSETRSVRTPKNTGKKVTGTPTAVGAPSIQLGDWVDAMGAPDTDAGIRHYQLHRTIPGSRSSRARPSPRCWFTTTPSRSSSCRATAPAASPAANRWMRCRRCSP